MTSEESLDPVLLRPDDIHLTERIVGGFFLIFAIIEALFVFKEGKFIAPLIPLLLLLFIARQMMDMKAMGPDIKVSRHLSRNRIVEGDEVEIKFVVKNTSSRATNILEFQDMMPSEFKVIRGSNTFALSLQPYEEVTLRYVVQAPYIGRYTFDLVKLRHRDFLGVTVNEFYLTSDNSPGLSQTIFVVPRLDKVETLPILTEWMKLYNGFFVSKHLGHDSDFRGIREFMYGDTIRRVNWKTSARFQASMAHPLFSNTYNWDKGIEAELVLDATFSAYSVWTESLRAVTSLAEFLLRNRNQVGLTVVGQFPEHIRPRIGKRHLRTVTNRLLMVQPEKIGNKEVFGIRMSVISRNYDSKAIIIVVSPFLEKVVLNYVEGLREKNFSLLAITPLAIEKQLAEIPHTRAYAHETPVVHQMVTTNLRLDQLKLRNLLKNQGIPVIEWRTDVPISETLRHAKVR